MGVIRTMNKIKEGLKSMTIDKLRGAAKQLGQEALVLRVKASTSHIKDYSLFRKTRKNMARILTFIQQKEKSVSRESSLEIKKDIEVVDEK